MCSKLAYASIALALLVTACPATVPTSSLPLAGDPEMVGTWYSEITVGGISYQKTSVFDSAGNCAVDSYLVNERMWVSSKGKWYADPTRGFMDQIMTWNSLDDPTARGLAQGLYEVRGDTYESWFNPIDMARPTSRETAALHLVATRTVLGDSGKATDVVDLSDETIRMLLSPF